MVRILIAAAIAAVIYQAWLFSSWMVWNLHGGTLGPLPDAAPVTEALQRQDLADGVYVRPFTENSDEFGDPESEFTQQHLAGPIFTIYFQREGGPPMPPRMFAVALGMNFFAAAIVGALLSCTGGCCRGYLARVGFVLGIAVFASIVTHGAYWNWMGFPTHYTAIFIVDLLVGWTLAGLVIAALVRPPAETSVETGT